MKKNRKGFTLVELLAAIVILGIISVFALPTITGMVESSRNKIYVNDAKKLISQAEYKIKVGSSNIEKPDPGDCIAISLVYLDNSDFASPPNNGTYEKESSFVVVKNNDGKLEYSAMLVEHMKNGGYKGVELTTNQELLSTSALDHVVLFEEKDLVNVEVDVDKKFINKHLGSNYLTDEGNVTAIYNYPDLVDSSALNVEDASPKIAKATIASSSGKEFGTLKATLTLRVDDADTPRKNLKVYISLTGYEETNPIAYGDKNLFTMDIDFSKYGYSYEGETVHVYILVKDPEGNEDRKDVTYQIHKNVAPEINVDASSIKKRDSDSVAMLTSQVTLSVSDDIDSLSDLSVCLVESDTNAKPDTCSNWEKFYTHFSEKNQREYTFHECSGGCKRDGSTHYLTIFVKDKEDLISSETFAYQFSVNERPIFTEDIEVVSKVENFTNTKSKNVTVRVRARDDVDLADDLTVTIEEVASNGTTSNSKSYTYSSNDNNNDFDYQFSGNYDGSVKKLRVYVTDKEGLNSLPKTADYTLYKNEAPVISTFSVESNGEACLNKDLCPLDDGGSKNVRIMVDLTDDIDYANNYSAVRVCVSEVENDCKNDSNYVSYANYHNKSVAKTLSGGYDGSNKTIYLYAKDSYGETTKKTYTYPLYENKAPLISSFTVDSENVGFTTTGSLNTIIRIDASDDFDGTDALEYTLMKDDTVIINKAPLSNYQGKNFSLTLGSSYDGKTYKLKAIVTDRSGKSSTETVEYTVYSNEPPSIDDFTISSVGYACNYPNLCPMEDGGNYKVHYHVSVSDDSSSDDGTDGLQICVSETPTCTNYRPYSDFYELNGDEKTIKEMEYTFEVADPNKPFDGSNKTLYVFAKDSEGAVAYSSLDYKIYKNQPPTVRVTPTVTPSYNPFGINLPAVSYIVDAYDDLDDTFVISYCKKVSGSTICFSDTNYPENGMVDLTNESFFHVDSYNGQKFEIYSVLKDSYGESTTTDGVIYTLYSDEKPVIESVDVALGDIVYRDDDGNLIDENDAFLDRYRAYQQMTISFEVRDYFDTYQVCISEVDGSCLNYSEDTFDGTDVENNTISYEHMGTLDSGANLTIYLYVRDSHGNVVKASAVSEEYEECGKLDLNSGKYEYVFDSSKTYYDTDGHAVTNNQKISMDRCERKCYHYNPITNEVRNIFGYYTKTVTYRDKFNTDKVCSENALITDFQANCSFKDCFYLESANDYKRKAIGLYTFEDMASWTLTTPDKVYENTSHYKLYDSDYNEFDEDVTLVETPTKISPEALENGYYDSYYDSSNPYVRIADSKGEDYDD